MIPPLSGVSLSGGHAAVAILCDVSGRDLGKDRPDTDILGTMADLLLTGNLATWTQNDPAEVDADPFAIDLIAKISELFCFLGGHPDWTLEPGEDQAPFDVRMLALMVAKRSYENPTRIIAEASIGPIGGDRFADAQALFTDLTETERETVTKYNPDGDPNPTGGAVFTIPTTMGEEPTLQQTSPLYMGDNQQIGLAASPDPREWMVPMFNPGDPGDDSLYQEI